MGTWLQPTAPKQASVQQSPFFALLAANAISLNGNALAQLGIPWFVLETTGSAAQTGAVAFAGLLPIILAALFGGAVVDRLGPKQTSIVADIASLLAISLIPFLHAFGLLPFWLLLLLVFLGALLDTPGATARASLLPELADLARMRLERANTLHEVVESGAQFTGPLLAGLLISWLGPTTALWLDAATFVLSAGLTAAFVPVLSAPKHTQPTPTSSYAADVVAGLQFVRRDHVIRSIFVSATALNFVISPLLTVVMTFYMMTVYNNAANLGLVTAAFGSGAIIGAIIFGVIGHRLPRRPVFVIGVAAIGAAITTLAFLPPLPVMVSAMLLGGLISGPNGPLVATVLQERTPSELRGRVFGATTAVGFAAAPLGVLIAGYAVQAVGVQPTLVCDTIIFLVVTAWLVCDRRLHDMDVQPTVSDSLVPMM